MALLNEEFDSLSLFYENDSTVIFKGISKKDQTPVILKSHKNPDEMFRIKHEYDLLHGNNIQGVTNVLDISYNDDKNYLVLEDCGSIVLDHYMAENSIDTKTFLTIAKNAAEALSTIHAQGIVHCDIKPANMLIHPDTLQITYIDFGISFSLHHRESRLEGFAGTLDYMAPEQTGRLNMTVDTRSDLYSLGITLYSMLTGNLPFTGETAVELIHAQTVLPPTPISEYVQADPVISSLIMKLMEKSPRKRYQSANSLVYDLDRCLSLLADDGSVGSFTLGEKDVFVSLEPGHKLYGKEAALEEMKSLFHSVPKDQSSLILLHGPADSGKSSLLSVFEEHVEENNGYLLKGSFDWKEDPELYYSAIRDAFEGFELYAYNANLPLPEYRNRLLEALGENAQVLIDIIPSMESVLGKQAPVRKLNALESQERARMVFQKTIEILCDAPYPYVFVFENLQWADPNSINLLLSAIEGKQVGNCVMVLSYRDDDPAFLKSFTHRIHSLERATLHVTDLSVPHLNKHDVLNLISDLFEHDDLEAKELADIIYNATGGVLHQIRSCLQMMYRSKQVVYEADTDSWSVHLENMDQDVLVDMAQRYQIEFDGFTEHGRDYLSKLACMGQNFNIEEAAYIFDIDQAELATVMQAKADYNWIVPDKRGEHLYSFASKTIYDLCYEQLPEEERNANHVLIVNKLFERYKDLPEEMLKRSTLFTRQILFSDRSLFSEETIQQICEYKLMAAMQIMESANMSQAARTFENGIRLLGENPFEANHRLAYELHLNFAMCCFAQHEDEKAMALFETVLSHVETEDETYNAYYKIVHQYISTAEWEFAKVYCKRYLAGTGYLLGAEDDIVKAGDAEYKRFQELTGDDGIAYCLTLKEAKDPLVEHHGNILALLSAALLFSLEDDKCKYYLYRAINLAAETNSVFKEFYLCFCVGAARYASIRGFRKAKWLIETGLDYSEKFHSGQAFLWCVYGNMISHWVNPLSETLEIYKKAKYHALMEGNAFYEAFADMMLHNYHSFVGENLEEFHRETMTTLHNLERSRVDALQANFTTFRQYARCLMGRTQKPDSFDDAQFKEADLESIRSTWHGKYNDNFLFVYRMRALFIHRFYEEAVEYGKRYAEFSKTVNLSAYITHIQFYYYYSMSLIALCKFHPEKREEYLAIVQENQKSLGYYAKFNPKNFEFKHMLVNTAVKCLTDDNIELVDELAQCHRGFLAKGLIWDVIFVERIIADFWEHRNIPQYVEIHKKNALAHYKDIGARYMIKQLADVDDEKSRKKSNYSHTMHTTQHTTHINRSVYGSRNESTMYSGINIALDFQALLGMLDKLIQMDTLPALSNKLVSLLMKNGNAEKALLFLDDGAVTKLVSAKYAVESAGDFNESELPVEISILEDRILPKKLIEMAKTKGETLTANSARNEFRMIGDDYLNGHVPESFLCIPITAKDKHLGVVYLENASLGGSFPEGRVRLLQAVVSQASALILNLQNVAVMEGYTKDLERRLSSYLGQQNALIAGIAHEINSPVGVCLTVATKMYEKTLSVIEAFTGKALSKSALLKYLEETKDGLNIINNNIVRAGDLVQNFKKMSVEQSTEVFENLELLPTLKNIVEYIRPGVKKKIDKINIEVPDDLWVYSSSGVLAQIFTNLIMNSAIHGFENMEKENCFAEIKVSKVDNRDEIEIRYSDNGKGMSEEEQSKVFQPFYTTKRNRGGSGLGGHIVLTHVTQTLKGSIRCISAPGEGTTFVIRLPKNKPEEAKEVQGND